MPARWTRFTIGAGTVTLLIAFGFVSQAERALWALALDGQPVGATAKVIAGLAGLPPYAWVTVTVVLLLAALQVLAGAWLARGVIPRGKPEAGTKDRPEAGTSDVNIGQA